MVEVLTPELTFGRHLVGTGTDSVTGKTRRLIWIDKSADFINYLDFKNSYFRAGNSISPAASALPGYVYTRTGSRVEFDASGAAVSFSANQPPIITGIGYIPRTSQTNLYLNAGSAANLVTQDVTVTAQTYTISFVGTGTITLSGAFVGSLVGTGANNRVVLNFTAAAGTLTSTVTGNVTYATLETGTLQNGGAVVPTAGASATAGADALALTNALASGDQIIWARANIIAHGTGNFYLATFANSASGTPTEAIKIIFANSIPQVLIVSGGVNVINQNGAGQAAGVFNLFALRSGGTWRCGMVTGGVLTYFGTATSAAFPSSIANLYPGELSNATNQLNNILEGVYTKAGTFADADILALLTNT